MWGQTLIECPANANGVQQRSPGSRSAPWVARPRLPKPQRAFHLPTITRARSRIMPQSLAQIYVHIVFSTKHRKPFLKDVEFRERTYRYLAGICKNFESSALAIGGVEDHVHLLCRLARCVTVADLVRDLKRDSTKWIKLQQPQLAQFHWQHGYGAFSISPSHVDSLKGYITNQEEHHRHESFQDELRRLCAKYRLELDERYVWE